jgi:hypothetical protein
VSQTASVFRSGQIFVSDYTGTLAASVSVVRLCLASCCIMTSVSENHFQSLLHGVVISIMNKAFYSNKLQALQEICCHIISSAVSLVMKVVQHE